MLHIFVLMAALVITEFATAKPLSKEEMESLTPYLNKEYKLTSSDEKFDEILNILEVPTFKRAMVNIATPVMKLTVKNGEYTLSAKTIFKNIYVKFRMNEEFDETTPDDRKVRTTFTQDKNKLVQVQRGKKTTKITREFTPEKVKVTTEVDGIVSVRVYSAL